MASILRAMITSSPHLAARTCTSQCSPWTGSGSHQHPLQLENYPRDAQSPLLLPNRCSMLIALSDVSPRPLPPRRSPSLRRRLRPRPFRVASSLGPDPRNIPRQDVRPLGTIPAAFSRHRPAPDGRDCSSLISAPNADLEEGRLCLLDEATLASSEQSAMSRGGGQGGFQTLWKDVQPPSSGGHRPVRNSHVSGTATGLVPRQQMMDSFGMEGETRSGREGERRGGAWQAVVASLAAVLIAAVVGAQAASARTQHKRDVAKTLAATQAPAASTVSRCTSSSASPASSSSPPSAAAAVPADASVSGSCSSAAAEGPVSSREGFFGEVGSEPSSSDGRGAAAAAAEEGKELGGEVLFSQPAKLSVPLRLVAQRGAVPTLWLKDFAAIHSKQFKLSVTLEPNLASVASELLPASKLGPGSGAGSEPDPSSHGAALNGGPQQQRQDQKKTNKKKSKSATAETADLVSVGDSWLTEAIGSGALTALPEPACQAWMKKLGPKWEQFLRRSEDGQLDPQGSVYAVPYRYGSLLVAVRKDKLAQAGLPPFQDWSDLFRSDLRRRIAMVESHREVFEVLLRSLGAPFNCRDVEGQVEGGREAVRQRWLQLQDQVLFFSSDYYLKALSSGDVWVAVGWSPDIKALASKNNNLDVITPKSGTLLWADLWGVPHVKPTTKGVGSRIYGPSPFALPWIDFCFQPSRQFSLEANTFPGYFPLRLSEAKSSPEAKVLQQGNDVSDSAEKETADDYDGTFVLPLAKVELETMRSILAERVPRRNLLLQKLEELKGSVIMFGDAKGMASMISK